jgi:hypothetical protein
MCGKSIIRYDFKKNRIEKILCHKFTCYTCRKILKKKLFNEIIEAVKKHNMNNHIIITVSGKSYREKNNIEKSFDDINSAWNKIRKIIRSDYDKEFSYIALPRAQKDGYAHLHVICNYYLPKNYVQYLCKRYKELGFIKIGKNSNPAKYLCNDFFKDKEWWIPENKHHYNTSMNIKLNVRNMEKYDNDNNLIIRRYNPNFQIKEIDLWYEKINEKFYYPLPFEEYLKYFVEITKDI